jgi:hypothetical protein
MKMKSQLKSFWSVLPRALLLSVMSLAMLLASASGFLGEKKFGFCASIY